MASRRVMLIATTAMAVVTASAKNYVVGGDDSWDLDVNYGDWGDFNDFKVGDTLEFIYSGNYTVVMVGEESYEACTVPTHAPTWDTGDDTVELHFAGKIFFICGVEDHCNSGMKLAVIVQ